MPAVINVGGPVAWGLVVLVSAWAVRAGRALARRRRAQRKEQEDEALLHDPNAYQPPYLQRLSATAIRMLIETGALPCAVLELAESSVAGGNGRGRVAAGSGAVAGALPMTASSSQQQQQRQQGGSAAAANAFAPPRIVPPELAAAVPCMTVAAWARALSGGEAAWREELTRAAAAAAASLAAAGSSLRSSYASSYCSSKSIGRDGGGAVREPYDSAGSGSSAGVQLQQRPMAVGRPVGDLYRGCSERGGRASGGAAAGVAAAAATNMAQLPYPPRHALLVVLGRSERSVAAVTAAAAAAGFTRVAVWVGPAHSFATASLGGPRLPAISRHALWLVLQLGPEPLFHVPSIVLDVRRPDERLSYGAIRGTVNIPADELAAALALPALEFRRRYGVAAPCPRDVVVLHSRAGRRAAWAAQVCVDAGLHRVFVYGEGVCGWRLEDRVKPYRAYDLGALPPDPEPFSSEEPDEATGFEELHELGLPLRPGPRPLRFSVGLLRAAGAGAATATATAAAAPGAGAGGPTAVTPAGPAAAAATVGAGPLLLLPAAARGAAGLAVPSAAPTQLHTAVLGTSGAGSGPGHGLLGVGPAFAAVADSSAGGSGVDAVSLGAGLGPGLEYGGGGGGGYGACQYQPRGSSDGLRRWERAGPGRWRGT